MKVIIITGSILPISQTFVKEQTKALKRWLGILAGSGIDVNGVDVSDINVLHLPGGRKWSFNWWAVRLFAAFEIIHSKTYQVLSNEKASLIHIHFADVAVRYSAIIKKMDLPTLITIHGTDINTYKSWWESGKGGFLNKSYPKKLLMLSQHPKVKFIAVSNSIKKTAIEFGIPKEKIIVSYIGVDVERFKPSGLSLEKRAPTVLFVGRMIENKGPLVLVEAFRKVVKKVPEATLTMIGDGPLLEETKKKAAEYNLPIKFLGAQPSAEVTNQLNQSKVFCLPSYTLASGKSEGMPIVTLEAQSCGVPVVTSARGASTEGIIDGITGFSFKEGCVDELYEKLVKALEDKDFTKLATKAARDFVCSKFDIKKCNEKLEKIYDEHAKAVEPQPY